MKNLQERLLFARERAGKSQKEVAEFIGIAQPSYSLIESGDTKRTKYIAEIAHFLGVQAYWLATGKGRMDREMPDYLYEKVASITNPEARRIAEKFIDSLVEEDQKPSGK